MRKELSDTIDAYNSSAQNYEESIGQLENYDTTYNYFIQALPSKGAVLDLACGTGVIARRIKKARPHIELTGVDLSSGMLAIAKKAVPDGIFVEADISAWKPARAYNGIVIGFGLPYLNGEEAVALIARSSKWLVGGGSFYASFMQGTTEGWERASFSPDAPLYLYYHDEAAITNAMIQAGIIPEKVWHLQYIESDGSETMDVVVSGRKR